jgi:hypothetical protein
MIDATSIIDNSSLERVRIFPNIMEETTCRRRRACIKAAPKSAGKRRSHVVSGSPGRL